MVTGRAEVRAGAVDLAICCPACGAPGNTPGNPEVRHGAIAVAFSPVEVRWRGQRVPLSRSEAHLFAQVALRGRATFGEIDAALAAIDVRPRQRRKLLHHIRRRFGELGAADPLAPLHQVGLRIADAYRAPAAG